MVTRAQVVAEARGWLGTPFEHQGRVQGAGVDCIGLLIGVAQSLGLTQFDVTGYARAPSDGLLQGGCREHLQPVQLASAQPGDVLLMRFKREPQHVGLVADYVHGGLSVIHSYQGAGGVVEHRLDALWLRRVVSVWRIPGVVDE